MRTFALLLIVAAVFAALGWLAYNTVFQRGEAPNEETDVVESPEISNMDQVAEYTGDKDVPTPDSSIILKPFDKGDHIYGSLDAEISIIEYSNFGNRYAALFHPELRRIVDSSAGDVRWVFRHFPMSESDFEPGEAAECVFRQLGNDGFWAFFDLAYAGDRSSTGLAAAAEKAGVERSSYDTCMNDRLGRPRVIGQAQDASLDANITVSPSYVIVNTTTGEKRMATGLNTVEYITATINEMR